LISHVAHSSPSLSLYSWVFSAGGSVCSHMLTVFYPEDGGDTFLRNVGSHKIYRAPHFRRRHSLCFFCKRPVAGDKKKDS
jgi:hypothetical protein